MTKKVYDKDTKIILIKAILTSFIIGWISFIVNTIIVGVSIESYKLQIVLIITLPVLPTMLPIFVKYKKLKKSLDDSTLKKTVFMYYLVCQIYVIGILFLFMLD